MIQLEGKIEFAPVDDDGVATILEIEDFSAEITSLGLRVMRSAIVRPPTFADAQQTTRAGATSGQLQINHFVEEGVSAGLFEFLYAQSLTRRAEVFFQATMQTGAISATNPEWSGIFTLTELDFGGTPGQIKTNSKTYPVRDLARATS